MTADPHASAAEAARQLRAVLAAIEAGELAAERDQVAWLRGAVAALDEVVEPGTAMSRNLGSGTDAVRGSSAASPQVG